MRIGIYDRGLASRLFDAANVAFMLLVMAATLYPMYHIAVVSVSDGNAVLRGEVGLLPVGFTLASYGLVLKDRLMALSLRNSFVYTTVGTLINLIFTSLCAYPLARPRFSGGTVLTWMIMVTMLFSGGLIPLYLVVLGLGMRNTIWSLVLPVAINPWNMFIMRTYFQQIPEEIYEAALIDGANDLQTAVKVILPLAKPIIATLVLFYAVSHWNGFFNALIFLDEGRKYPVQLVLRNIIILGRFDQHSEMSSASDFAVISKTLKYATIMVATMPILVIYPFVQKHFVRGVMIGAIKG